MNVVEKQKLQAKWNDDIARRRNIAKRIDYYENNQLIYLKKAIERAYPRTALDMFKKYAYTYPLTQRIYDDISIMFSEALDLTIDQEKLQETFDQIMFDANINAIMNKVNLLVNITDKCGVIPVWRDGKVDLDIITADNCFVVQSLENPTQITELYYQVGITENSPTNLDSVCAYIKWTKDTQSIVDVDNGSGNIQNEREIKPNRFGVIPVVWFTNDIEVNSFWFNKTNPVVETNEIVNCELTNYRYIMAFQAFSTLVEIGNPSPEVKAFGASYSLRLPFDMNSTQTPDAKYITPDPKLEAVWNVIMDIIIGVAQSVGISADAYRRENTTFNSGYQLKLSKQDIIKKTINERPFYRRKLKKLIELMLMLYTQNNASKTFERANVKIDFGELQFDDNPMEREQIRAMRLANGTANEIDFIMEDNPDLSRDEAIEHYKKLQEEKKSYKIGAGILEAINEQTVDQTV